MKTADISMDYGSMEALASQIETMQEDFETMCTNLDSLIEDLKGQWQGKAQIEFAAAYSKLKPKLKTINEVLSQYSVEILNAVGMESETEDNSANMFEETSFA